VVELDRETFDGLIFGIPFVATGSVHGLKNSPKQILCFLVEKFQLIVELGLSIKI
jgi:hypothetical protein